MTTIYDSTNIDISKVTIEDAVRDVYNSTTSCQITYNGSPLKIRIPVGLVTGFQVQEQLFHTDGSGHTEVIPGASLTCIIGFNGCDPYGKERCVAESSVGSIYNFVLWFQEHVVSYCVENGVKIFGKNRSEGVVRESMTCFHVDVMKKDNGEWVPSGKGRPSISPKIAYSEMERHGDVRMEGYPAWQWQGVDPRRTFPDPVSPNVATREFYMTPSLLVLQQNRLRIAWKVGYV